METSQFEAKKVALKQTKDGIVMSLAIHPDELPEELMRDFVGARYMVVMVRLGDDEKPLNRDDYAGAQMVKLAGMLCRDSTFWDYLYEQSFLLETNESACIEWLKNYLNVHSRADIKTNLDAQGALKLLYGQYKEWKNE
jgi:hypothetical protein